MAATIGTAYVQISPTTDGITEQLSSALGGAASSAGASSGSSFGSSFGKGLLGVAGTLAAATTATIGAAVKAASDVAKAGDEIDKQSQKVGVSAEQYQAMAYAAEHCGFSVSTFNTAAKALANSDFDGTVYDAVNALKAIEDPAERAAQAQELLGTRAAQEMAALINGEQSLDDYKASLEGLGGMMSNESVANAAAFEDALTDMKTALEGLKTGLVADFLPAITEIMNGIAAFASGDEGGVQAMTDGVKHLAQGIIDALPSIIAAGADIIIALLNALIENLPMLLQVALELVVTLAKGILDALPKLLEVGLDIVRGIWQGISDGYDWIVGKIRGWVDNVIDYIKNLLGIHSPSTVFADTIGKNMALGIGEGFEDAIGDVNDDIGDSINTSYGITADQTAAGRNMVQIVFNAKELTQADIDMVINRANMVLGGAM